MEEANSRRDSWSKEEACIELTNHLIILCNLTFPRVSSLSDINSQLFTLLFETITGLVLHDLIPEPRSIEDEAHNIQTVIDTLSLDILNISLSHIIGEDIVKQNAISIYNLLEVMENYLLYSIQSTTQSDKIEAERDEFVSADEHPVASSISTWTQTDAIFEEMLYPQQKENVTSLAGTNEEDHNKRHSEIICPLCTLTSEQTDDIKQINGEENIKEIADILKEIGNQSVYKKLSTKHDSITSIKHPYVKSSTSSSTTVLPEQDTTSSSFISPITAESQYGIHPRSPDFSKVVRESSEGKSSVGSTDKSSQTLVGKTESSSETSGIPQIRTQMLRKIATLKKRRQESSDSSEKYAKKKNVRFSSKDALKDFDARNLQNYKEKVKDDLENFQIVSESSEFVNDVYKDIFNAPQQKFPPVRKRYICRTRTKHPSISKRSPNKKHIQETSIEKEESTSENEFLQYLQKEMPGIYLSPATKRRMQNQYHQHLRLLGNQLRDYNSRKTKTEKQYDEAMRRKEKLSRILKKERDHNQRMKKLKEERQLHQRVKSTLRDNQMNRIQMKQSYDDHQQFLKSKLNRRKTKEEKLMRELYEEGLAIQKEELRELRKLAKEREEKEARNHQIYMESMENFYKNQLEMLTETINEEKNKLKQSAKAQTRVLEQIRRDFRNKMEQEIKDSRNRLLADGDIHFREMDAERLRNSWKKKGIRILPSNQAHKGRKY